MTRYREKRINKILTIAIVILTVFILICAYELKLLREEEQQDLAKIREKLEAKENKVTEVLYYEETFGSEIDYAVLNPEEFETLDEYEGLKFVKNGGIFFMLNDDGTLPCEYLYNEEKEEYNYRYCDVKVDEDKSYRIDFSKLKFIKNND